MDIQQFDIDEFILQYLPPFLRKAKIVGFIRALLSPLVAFRYNLLVTIYPAVERRARYNSQVIVFETLLNFEFNYINREITISADNGTDHVYTYKALELIPVYVYNTSEASPLYIKNSVEYVSEFDFTVRVPIALFNTSLPRLKSLINKYKLVGTNYRIITY